jgi:hypothetical protein
MNVCLHGIAYVLPEKKCVTKATMRNAPTLANPKVYVSQCTGLKSIFSTCALGVAQCSTAPAHSAILFKHGALPARQQSLNLLRDLVLRGAVQPAIRNRQVAPIRLRTVDAGLGDPGSRRGNRLPSVFWMVDAGTIVNRGANNGVYGS